MYAVIKTGGKQYRVASGEKLKVEQIAADVGAEIVLDQVLMVGDGDSVSARHARSSPARRSRPPSWRTDAATRCTIFKMRRRKHYQKHQGHRQNFTEIEDRRRSLELTERASYHGT